MAEKQQRRCVACREIKNQHEMLRVAKLSDSVEIDETGKLGGRGAYVCKDKTCIEKAIKKRLFNGAFKCNLNSEIYEKLGAYEQNN